VVVVIVCGGDDDMIAGLCSQAVVFVTSVVQGVANRPPCDLVTVGDTFGATFIGENHGNNTQSNDSLLCAHFMVEGTTAANPSNRLSSGCRWWQLYFRKKTTRECECGLQSPRRSYDACPYYLPYIVIVRCRH